MAYELRSNWRKTGVNGVYGAPKSGIFKGLRLFSVHAAHVPVKDKTEKEYLCVKEGEERGFAAAEYKDAQHDGWEKQYPYWISKKKKEYMTPSQAQAKGLERASKYAKSTKYGRQNPISAKWNSEEQLIVWRTAWADAVNLCLEHKGMDERIDHRSHAERGIKEHPTIHEGVASRAMEAKGFISDRCELNRQIKTDNAMLRILRETLEKLTAERQDGITQYEDVYERIQPGDEEAVRAERQRLRTERESRILETVSETYGDRFDPKLLSDVTGETDFDLAMDHRIAEHHRKLHEHRRAVHMIRQISNER